MADQVRVFVSHHHSPEEDAFTVRLVADLEAAGADVWVDDQRITSDDFIEKINEGLVGRQWLVLVMTPAALRSPWVQAEANAALNQVRKGRMLGVIPIVAEPCDDEDIPPLLDALHRYDATSTYEAARDGLLHAISLSAQTPGQPDALHRKSRSASQASAQARTFREKYRRQQVLQGLLSDVESDRDALSMFLNHARLGDESGHVISEVAGLDIWYDDVLSTRALPDLLASRNLEDVRALRYSFSPHLDIDAALSKLLQLYERLPHGQQTLAEELTHDDGRDLWRDYLAWEEADRLNADDPVRHFHEREQLGRRWYTFKSASPIARKREECQRAFIDAREQCETIMRMVTEELKHN